MELLHCKFLNDLESEKNMQFVKVKPPSKIKQVRRDSFMK